MLLEVPTVFLIHQHQVDVVSNREAFVYVFVGGRKLHRCQVEAHGDALAFDWSTVHYLKLSQVLRLCHGFVSRAESLFANDVKFHMFDLNAHKVEEYLTKYAVLEVVNLS